jgi:hypothetical protein
MNTIITYYLECTPDWNAVNKAIACTPNAKIYEVDTNETQLLAIVVAPAGLNEAQAQKIYDEAFNEEPASLTDYEQMLGRIKRK